MQTALHIRALVAQLQREIVGGKIVGTEFYKKERTAYFFVRKEKTKTALGFVFHPAGHGVFAVPPSKVKIDTREKPWPIFNLNEAMIVSVRQPHLDRIFLIDFERENKRISIAVEALGPNGNIWLLDKDLLVLGTLRKRSFTEGRAYELAPFPDRISPFDLTLQALEALRAENGNLSVRLLLEKRLVGFNRSLARETIHRAGGPETFDDETGVQENQKLLESIRSTAQLFDQQDIGYIYQISGGLEAYPFKLKSQDSEPEKVKSLSLAILELVARRQVAIEERDEQKGVTSTVNRVIRKLQKRVQNIRSDIEKAADYESYKKYAELIQINLNKIKKGMASIELENIYSETGETVTINLNPALSPTENAEDYYKRHRKGREGLELLERRLEISEEELKQWQVILSELEDNFDHASQQYQPELLGVLPREAGKSVETVRLPYRVHQLTTGLTIYIGRDGSDNDRTTFEFARPYEFWFHAQQCPGSHVVMKFPHKSFEPSKLEIEETAAIAAWHSKARNDSMVPVIYTQRKYVRKPRKAKPGLVTVEREKSVMVKPGVKE
ncbi:MAG: NFACT family protein [bacterium]|nr:NFACT family protein [bacterium]